MSVFGEMQFISSRAVFDEEDDELMQVKEDENLKRKIYWLTEEYQQNKFKADELIIADGSIGSAFVFTYLLSHLNDSQLKRVALTGTKAEHNIYETNKDEFSNNSTLNNNQYSLTKIRNNFVYLIENLNGKQYVVCQLFNQLKSNETYDWIDQLWSRIEFTNSLVVCSQYKTTHYGEKVRFFPCVRFLSSIDKSDDNICPRLEEPNFITDLPAAVIHFSILKSLSYSTFIYYSNSISPDLTSLKELFNGITSRLKDKSAFLENDNSKKILLSVGNIVNSVSQLYM